MSESSPDISVAGALRESAGRRTVSSAKEWCCAARRAARIYTDSTASISPPPPIEGLASLREQLIERLREQIAAWQQHPKIALLFGSVARGEASADSDLDLLILRKRTCDPDAQQWREQLLELERSATAWTGNDARVIEYAEQEIETGPSEPLLEEALVDGIELFGSRRALRRLITSGSKR